MEKHPVETDRGLPHSALITKGTAQEQPDKMNTGTRPKTCFRFRPDVDDMLSQMVYETRAKKGEIVEDAIRFYTVLRRELNEGRVIITAEPDGSEPHKLVIT